MVDKVIDQVMTDSGLWMKDAQEPAQSHDWSLPEKPLIAPSASNIELPPSPVSETHSLDHESLTLQPLTEAIPEHAEDEKTRANEAPEETGYPSPASDHVMADEIERAPVNVISEATSFEGNGVESDPNKIWTEKNERVITRPFEYLMAKPGKSFRRQLLTALNVWTQVDEESLGIINRVVEMLHNASLLIDDIQDQSKLRRGGPAAHLIFGTAQTINAANYVYFLALQELTGLQNPVAAMHIFNEELLNLHRGQGLDLFWRDTLTVPTEEEYLQMVDLKTGGLFRLAARLLQSASSQSFNLVPLVDIAGQIFQIRDDYSNLRSESMMSGKGYCDDLTEGKFSFPVVHSIRNSPDGNNELLNILKQHTDDIRLKSQAVWYMQSETDSFEYTKEKLRALHMEARTKLTAVGSYNESFEHILSKLAVV
ncbi:MAG: hypothetical protein Q9220_002409 [cf. Caloplaca sp. 1 TL-2023]